MQNKIESVQRRRIGLTEQREGNVGVGGNQRKWAVAIIKLDL